VALLSVEVYSRLSKLFKILYGVLVVNNIMKMDLCMLTMFLLPSTLPSFDVLLVVLLSSFP